MNRDIYAFASSTTLALRIVLLLVDGEQGQIKPSTQHKFLH
jgi:hypothetical protein